MTKVSSSSFFSSSSCLHCSHRRPFWYCFRRKIPITFHVKNIAIRNCWILLLLLLLVATTTIRVLIVVPVVVVVEVHAWGANRIHINSKETRHPYHCDHKGRRSSHTRRHTHTNHDTHIFNFLNPHNNNNNGGGSDYYDDHENAGNIDVGDYPASSSSFSFLKNRRTATTSMMSAVSGATIISSIVSSSSVLLASPSSAIAAEAPMTGGSGDDGGILAVLDDEKIAYPLLTYACPNCNTTSTPLIIVLHGAGKNDQSIMQELGNPSGEHAGLLPNLIAASLLQHSTTTTTNNTNIDTAAAAVSATTITGTAAPTILLENFCVVAPYSSGKTSFYDEPRKNLVDLIDWLVLENQKNSTAENRRLHFDPMKIIVLGFSDGATVAVELLTTPRRTNWKFAAGVICSYGYSGLTLPPLALQRLQTIPMWIYHSADDVIFNVQNSDRLVSQLRSVNNESNNININHNKNNNNDNSTTSTTSIIRYSRYQHDPEQLPRRIQGHSMGITASKSTELYEWLLPVV